MKKNRFSKKIWLLLLPIIGLLITACGNGETETSQDSLTLAVWGSSPAETEALEQTIASFEEETDIDVNLEVIQDSFEDALTARFAADNAPDVFYLESFVAPKFIASGVLEDISDELENQEDFYDPLIDAFRDEEGNLYAAPKDYSTLATYINVNMLEEAGYSVEDVPSSWDELLTFSEELQKELDDGQAAMIFDSTMARQLSSLKANGLDPVTKDDKADFTSSDDALAFLQDIVDGNQDGYLLNPQIDLGIDSAGAAFGSNKAVIMIEGNWVISALNQEYSDVDYEVIPAPIVNGQEQSMSFNVGYAVAKDAKSKDAAIEFVNYMTGDGLKQWSEISGTLPPRDSVAEEMKLDENEKLQAHIEAADYGTVWASGINLPTISSSFDNYFSAALNGDMTIEEAMEQAELEANEEIERQE